MRPVNRQQVSSVLRELGLQAGDGLLVHSAVQFFGQPVGGVGMYLGAFDEVIQLSLEQPGTVQGTLAVPAFNFAFARGETYDPQTTPAQGMGAFSEYIRQYPGARRTPHPMQSLAVLGRWAADLAGRDTPSAFDPGSAFERLLDLDFKLVLLGADIQAASMLHLSEQRLGVPYRYWKEFTGRVSTPVGLQTRTYRMYVRDLDLDPKITLQPVQAVLEQRGLWFSRPLNYGHIRMCRLADFVRVMDEFLAADPWSLVTNRPGRHGAG